MTLEQSYNVDIEASRDCWRGDLIGVLEWPRSHFNPVLRKNKRVLCPIYSITCLTQLGTLRQRCDELKPPVCALILISCISCVPYVSYILYLLTRGGDKKMKIAFHRIIHNYVSDAESVRSCKNPIQAYIIYNKSPDEINECVEKSRKARARLRSGTVNVH